MNLQHTLNPPLLHDYMGSGKLPYPWVPKLIVGTLAFGLLLALVGGFNNRPKPEPAVELTPYQRLLKEYQ